MGSLIISKRTRKLTEDHRTAIECLLERGGSVLTLQKYRYHRWIKAGGNIGTDPVTVLLSVEWQLRLVAQKELSLRDEVRNIPENDVPGAKSLYQELDALSKKYWLLEREWWQCRGNFKVGPLTRAFDLWRSHPRWYMHPVLREDCVQRGGCCGRGCGCCTNRAISSARKLGHGHCTVECACCRKARGFDFDDGQKNQMEVLFEFSCDNETKVSRENETYLFRIYRVSIWGIAVGYLKSPFDLVDESLKL